MRSSNLLFAGIEGLHVAIGAKTTENVSTFVNNTSLVDEHTEEDPTFFSFFSRGLTYSANYDEFSFSDLSEAFSTNKKDNVKITALSYSVVNMDRDNMVVMPGLMGEAPVKIKKNRRIRNH